MHKVHSTTKVRQIAPFVAAAALAGGILTSCTPRAFRVTEDGRPRIPLSSEIKAYAEPTRLFRQEPQLLRAGGDVLTFYEVENGRPVEVAIDYINGRTRAETEIYRKRHEAGERSYHTVTLPRELGFERKVDKIRVSVYKVDGEWVVLAESRLIEEFKENKANGKPRRPVNPLEAKEKAASKYQEGLKNYTSGKFKDALACWEEALVYDPENRDLQRDIENIKVKMEKLSNKL